MSCWGCMAAERDPNTGRYMAGCEECNARALSICPQFHESMKWRRMTPAYVDALKALAGEDWESLHQRTKKWAIRRGIL